MGSEAEKAVQHGNRHEGQQAPGVVQEQRSAVIASLIETCKMNGVNPQAYLRDVLARIVARHPMGRIDELLPFAYVSAADKAAA